MYFQRINIEVLTYRKGSNSCDKLGDILKNTVFIYVNLTWCIIYRKNKKVEEKRSKRGIKIKNAEY